MQATASYHVIIVIFISIIVLSFTGIGKGDMIKQHNFAISKKI